MCDGQATYQLTYQGKILTTACMSVLILNRTLSPNKWLALLVLATGIVLVQTGNGQSDSAMAADPGRPFVGLLAATIGCMCSSVAGVYFEVKPSFV